MALPSPVFFKTVSSTFALNTLGLARHINVGAAKKGWATSPVHKSVSANALKRIWNGVLTNVFFQIATKISAFPATATGDKTAITIEVAIENVINVVKLCDVEDVVLKHMARLWSSVWLGCTCWWSKNDHFLNFGCSSVIWLSIVSPAVYF